jgi:hypothetical protein
MGQRPGHRPRADHGGHTPPEVRVECSETHEIVRLPWGQFTLQATPDTLTLRAEATDEDQLRRIQELIATRLERFGRRDHLKVDWQRRSAPGHPCPDPPRPTASA